MPARSPIRAPFPQGKEKIAVVLSCPGFRGKDADRAQAAPNAAGAGRDVIGRQVRRGYGSMASVREVPRNSRSVKSMIGFSRLALVGLSTHTKG